MKSQAWMSLTLLFHPKVLIHHLFLKIKLLLMNFARNVIQLLRLTIVEQDIRRLVPFIMETGFYIMAVLRHAAKLFTFMILFFFLSFVMFFK